MFLQLSVILSTGDVLPHDSLAMHSMMHWGRVLPASWGWPVRKDQSGRKPQSLPGRTSKEGSVRKDLPLRGSTPSGARTYPHPPPGRRADRSLGAWSVHLLLEGFLVMRAITCRMLVLWCSCPSYIQNKKQLLFRMISLETQKAILTIWSLSVYL